MKYLSLTNREIKELLHIRKEDFVVYMITLFILIVGSYIFLQWVLEAHINFFLIFFPAIAYTIYAVYVNREYMLEILCKQKKVYRGALSFKTICLKSEKTKYLFNVDGRTFYVDKEQFDSIEEGDVVELHVSSSTKHLFRVEKVL